MGCCGFSLTILRDLVVVPVCICICICICILLAIRSTPLDEALDLGYGTRNEFDQLSPADLLLL